MPVGIPAPGYPIVRAVPEDLPEAGDADTYYDVQGFFFGEPGPDERFII